jgi:hypothetical protein
MSNAGIWFIFWVGVMGNVAYFFGGIANVPRGIILGVVFWCIGMFLAVITSGYL